MRRAARVDENQGRIVAALRKIGATVTPLHAVGKGCPDLLVGYRGRNYLMEVKQPRGRMTDDQKLWHACWAGAVSVVRSAEDALLILGAL